MNGSGPLDGASPALVIALTARFVLELALLAGVAILVWLLVPGWWHWPAAGLAVVAVAAVWGLLLSPEATIPLPVSAALVIEAALFLGTGGGLLAVGLGVAGGVGVTAWILDRVALALLRRRPVTGSPA